METNMGVGTRQRASLGLVRTYWDGVPVWTPAFRGCAHYQPGGLDPQGGGQMDGKGLRRSPCHPQASSPSPS